jgi:hypothetical protein
MRAVEFKSSKPPVLQNPSEQTARLHESSSKLFSLFWSLDEYLVFLAKELSRVDRKA